MELPSTETLIAGAFIAFVIVYGFVIRRKQSSKHLRYKYGPSDVERRETPDSNTPTRQRASKDIGPLPNPDDDLVSKVNTYLSSSGILKDDWRSDPATERQLARLEEYDVHVDIELTKGQASDIIGLFHDPEKHDVEILRFFKVKTAGMTQTDARYHVAQIMGDDENKEKWEHRPAETWIKEKIKFFSGKIPPKITMPAAIKSLEDIEYNLSQKQLDIKEEQWSLIEDLMDEFSDKDSFLRENFKKPTLTQAVGTLQKLIDSGDTSVIDDCDFEGFMEKAASDHPALRKT